MPTPLKSLTSFALISALSFAVGCSEPADSMSCVETRDCFSGEVCLRGFCQENGAGNREQNPGDQEQNPGDGEQNPGDQEQNPGDGEQEPGDEEQSPDQCKVSLGPGTSPCRTGLEDETDITGRFVLLPQGQREAGCQTRNKIETFQTVDLELNPTFCPNQKTFFVLPISPCIGHIFSASIIFESRAPACILDDLVDITFNNTPEHDCSALNRAHSCYIKTRHEDGSLEWTVYSDEYSSSSGQLPWQIVLGLKIEDLTSFPYTIRVKVPPLEP